jgi:hypothetical protein
LYKIPISSVFIGKLPARKGAGELQNQATAFDVFLTNHFWHILPYVFGAKGAGSYKLAAARKSFPQSER